MKLRMCRNPMNSCEFFIGSFISSGSHCKIKCIPKSLDIPYLEKTFYEHVYKLHQHINLQSMTRHINRKFTNVAAVVQRLKL